MSKVEINKDYILSGILIFSIKLKRIFKQIVKKSENIPFPKQFHFYIPKRISNYFYS